MEEQSNYDFTIEFNVYPTEDTLIKPCEWAKIQLKETLGELLVGYSILNYANNEWMRIMAVDGNNLEVMVYKSEFIPFTILAGSPLLPLREMTTYNSEY